MSWQQHCGLSKLLAQCQLIRDFITHIDYANFHSCLPNATDREHIL